MLALGSVWLGLATLAMAASMVIFRPAFNDITVVLVAYFGSPGSLCLGGLVLWAYRKDVSSDPAVHAQRLQAKIGIVLGLFAAAIVYALVIFADRHHPGSP